MTVFRWIVFVPLAFIASVVAGALGHIIGNFFGWMFWGPDIWYAWFMSGLFSAFAFVWVGVNVAPRITGAVKWTLVGLIAVLGAMATLGGFVEGGQTEGSIAGVVMVVVAIAVARMSLSDLGKLAREV